MVAELRLPDFSTEDPFNRLITGDWIFILEFILELYTDLNLWF